MLVTMLAVIVSSYLLLCGALYIYQERFIFFPEVLVDHFTYTFPGTFEELRLSVDGATINALHFRTTQPKGVILYFHGNAGSLRSWGTVAADFVTHGYDVFIPDYRGYGKSTGSITSERMLHDDAARIYTYLLGHYPEQQIIIYGRSLGSGVAVYLAKTHQPNMLILETPYFNLTELATAQFPLIPSMLLKYPLRSDLWIGQVSCPIYLLHGTDDQVIPYSSSVRLAEQIQTKHRLFLIEGGGHNNLNAFAQYHEALANIFY